MRKTHYIPVTADVPGAAGDANCALIRRTIRTALAAEGVTAPCEVDVLLTDDEGIHRINLEQRQVDAPTDVLSFPMFDLTAMGFLVGQCCGRWGNFFNQEAFGCNKIFFHLHLRCSNFL